MSTKPKWLIAGGMGMIGRNLVKYLLDNNLASDIRVADKKAPFMAFLRCARARRVMRRRAVPNHRRGVRVGVDGSHRIASRLVCPTPVQR